MARFRTTRIPTDGGNALSDNPFAACDFALPASSPVPAPVPASAFARDDNHGQAKPAGTGGGAGVVGSGAAGKPFAGVVHLRIEKARRGGKTVTVLFGSGVEQLAPERRVALLRDVKRALGVGGTAGAPPVTLEFQGDERPRIAAWLRAAGFSCKG